MIENRTKFIPIRGELDKIRKAEKKSGSFYIATDTGEMFLDISNTERIPIGGSGVKLYYTQQAVLEEDKIGDNDLYQIWASSIKSNFNLNSAQVDDIIIEQDTDNFFRIREIVESSGYDDQGQLIPPYLLCSRLAFSGTGEDTSSKVRIVFKNLDEISAKMQQKGTLYIYGESFPLTFRPWMETGNAITVTCKLIANGTTYYTFAETVDVTIDAANTVEFDIGKMLHTGKTTIYIEATGGGNIPATLTYEANTINFELKKTEDFKASVPIQQGDDLIFKAIPIGGIKKIFHYAIDAPEDNTNKLLGFNPALAPVSGTEELSDKIDNNVYSFSGIPTEELTHGAHTLNVWMTDAQSGKIMSNILTYQIGIYNPDNQDAIVWITEKPQEIEIYDKLKVKFSVYDPASVGQDNYQFQKIDCMTEDNVILSTLGGSEYKPNEEFLWIITKFNLGSNGYKILYGEQEKVLFYVNVVGSSRENMTLSNTATLKVNLEASGRSNLEIASSRNYWPIKQKVNATDPDPDQVIFNNFNWSTDGWMTDEKTEDNYLLLANGANIQIPIPGATDSEGLKLTGNKKYTFEIRGRIKNIKDYSTLIKNNTKYEFLDPTPGAAEGKVIGPNLNGSKYGNYMSLEEVNEQYGKMIKNGDIYIRWDAASAELQEAALEDPSLIFTYKFSDADIKHDEFNAEKVQVFKDTGDTNKCCASFFSLDKKGIGLGTQETYFNSGIYVVNAKYKEEEIFSLTYVIDFAAKRAFIYLNGLLTGASILQAADFNMGKKYFNIDSTLCDFELYSFRFYEDALNAGHIVQNYLYDIRDVDTYDQNNIAEISDTGDLDISFDKFIEYNAAMADAKRPEMLTMPYLILEVVDNLGSDKYNVVAKDLPDHLANIDITDSIAAAGHVGNVYSKNKNDQRLPFVKLGGERLVRVSFVNPSLDYALEQGDLETAVNEYNRASVDDTIDLIDYYTSRCPSFEAYGAKLAVQGTSSQAYPRRNYKLKLKESDFWVYSNKKIRDAIMAREKTINQTNLNKLLAKKETTTDEEELKDLNKSIKKAETILDQIDHETYACPFCIKPSDTKTNKYSWRMEHDNPAVGTTKFTLKIDYMESSGSYNTGFANMINTMYEKHPLDYYVDTNVAQVREEDDDQNVTYTPRPDKYYRKNEYRTSVQGYPIAVFHKIKLSDNKYTYNFIGRYNMNLDKGSDDCYGFKIGDVNYATRSVKVKDGVTTDKASKFSKIAECWEMSNNQGTYCSFKPKIKDNGKMDDDWSDLTHNFSDHISKHIEYRYNDNEDYLDKLYECTIDGKSADSLTLGDIGLAEKPEKVDEPIIKTEQEIAAMTNEERTAYQNSLDNYVAYQAAYAQFTQAATNNDIDTATKKYYKNFIELLEWMYSVDVDRAIYETADDIPELEKPEYLLDTTNGNSVEFEYIETWQSEEDRFVKETIDDGTSNLTADNFYTYFNAFTNDKLYIDVTQDKTTQFYRTINFPCVINEDNITYTPINLEQATQDQKALFGSTGILKYDGKTIIKENTVIAINKVGESIITNNDISEAEVTFDIRATNTNNKLQSVSKEVRIRKTFEYNTKDYRRAKFKAEFNQHWNLDYCLIYFVMTELLLCYDSRGKNLMVASWGPMQKDGPYIWFPIFYDIDTQLGINNTGIPTWDYNINASVNVDDPSQIAFSTSQSVLWRNLLECYPTEIAAKYRELRLPGNRIGIIDENFIEHMYKCENGDTFSYYSNMGVRPLSILNADADFKYIKTTQVGREKMTDTSTIVGSSKLGYYNTSGQLKQDAGGAFFYAVQGDRDLSRRLLLRNRINYLDSYWGAGSYSKAGATGDTSAWMRLNANSLATTTDTIWFTSVNATEIKNYMMRSENIGKGWNQNLIDLYGDDNSENKLVFASEVPASRNAFLTKLNLEANPDFTIKPFLDQYITVGYDDIYTAPPIHAKGGESVEVKAIESTTLAFLSTPSLSQQLVYIPGAEYISSLGDLSVKYLDEIHLQGATRLIDLRLGNPSTTYFNRNLRDKNALGLADSLYLEDNKTLNPYRKTLLETVELSGLEYYQGPVDVSGSPKLQSLKALRTGTSSVILGENTPIKTLFLPNTIEDFTVKNLINLTSFIEPKALDVYPSEETGLYFAGFGVMSKFEILQDHLGYGSYTLVSKYLRNDEVNGVVPAGNLTNVNITGIDWMPYKLVESVSDIKSTKTYYKRKLNGTFEQRNNLDPTVDTTLAKQVTDKLLYEEKENTTGKELPDLATIQDIIGTHNNLDTKYVLSGNMFVNKTLSQTAMLDQVSQLKVYAKNTNPCRILHFVYTNGNNETIVYHTYKAEFTDANPIQPALADIDPILSNKDFLGWKVYKCTDEDGTKVQQPNNYFRVNVKYLETELPESYAKQTIKDETYISEFIDPTLGNDPERTTNDIYIYEAQFGRHRYHIKFVDTDDPTQLTTPEQIEAHVIDVAKFVVDGSDELKEGVPAGELIPKTAKIPLKVYNGTAFEGSYKFVGWRRGLDTSILENFNTARATMDRIYYPYFQEVSNGTEQALIDVTDQQSFRFINNQLHFINPDYSGKVTLPYYSPDGERIEQLIGLRETKITHVFWYNNDETKTPKEDLKLELYRENFGEYDDASYNNTILQYCEIPEGVKQIGNYSFRGCQALIQINIPGSVTSLGQQVFSNIGSYSRRIKCITIGSATNPVTTALFKTDTSNSLYQTFMEDVYIYYGSNVESIYSSVEGLGIGGGTTLVLNGAGTESDYYFCQNTPHLTEINIA